MMNKLFGSKADAAIGKIQGVIDGFKNMVADLEAGVSALNGEIQKNIDEMKSLEAKNVGYSQSVEKAIALRDKLNALVG